MKTLSYEQGIIRDLNNAVVDLITAVSIHDNGENCPYCGSDYVDVGEDEYNCPDKECSGNVAFDLLTKVAGSLVFRGLEGFKKA